MDVGLSLGIQTAEPDFRVQILVSEKTLSADGEYLPNLYTGSSLVIYRKPTFYCLRRILWVSVQSLANRGPTAGAGCTD